MANTTEKQPKKVRVSELIVDFIQKRRVILLSVLGVFIGFTLIAGGVFFAIDYTTKKSVTAVESLNEKYTEIRSSADSADKDAKIKDIIENLKPYASSKAVRFSTIRAADILGYIYAEKKDWNEAEKWWTTGASSVPKSYLASACLYNAATAAEERGDSAKALSLYNDCAKKYANDVASGARLYFAIGRLNEQAKNPTEAKVAYKKVVDTWPTDGFSKFANTRLIALSISESK